MRVTGAAARLTGRRRPCRPGQRRHSERGGRQHLAAAFAQPGSARRTQTSDVAAGKTDAEGERLPPIIEARMFDLHRQSGLLNFVQPGCSEQLSKVPFARTREPRLILDTGIELPRSLPKEAERPLTAGVIPDARRHDATVARDPRHLAKSLDGLCHEVNDELGQGRVEGLISKRQLLGRSVLHGDPGVTVSSCRHEGLRRIHGGHGGRTQSPHQFGRECAWAATDIEHSVAGRNCREVGKLGGERHRIPAHESVVGISPNSEGHRRNLRLGLPRRRGRPSERWQAETGKVIDRMAPISATSLSLGSTHRELVRRCG